MAKKRMSKADAIFKALTGRKAKETTWSHQVADLVKAFGKDGAKERLGVSDSTWRRWTSGRGAPSKGNAAKLGEAWNTREVRAAAIPKRRANKAARNGFAVKLTGTLGPTADPGYARTRSLAAQFPAEVAQEIMDAFIEGGPDAAHEAIQEALMEHYYGGDPDAGAILEDLTGIQFSARDGEAGGSFFDDFDE